jgi:hypothetical protein
VCEQETADITTQSMMSENRAPAGAITRTNKYFSFAQTRGVLLLDIDDLPKEMQPSNHAEARALLISAVPELAVFPMVISDSASSHIYRVEDGACLRGGGRYHVFIPVQNAAEIPQIGNILTQKMRGAGYIFDKESKSGARLRRTLIDSSVWQPSRLSFDSGSFCNRGLEQRRPAPSVFYLTRRTCA